MDTEMEEKRKTGKIITFILLGIILIVAFSALGIKAAQEYQENWYAKNRQRQSNSVLTNQEELLQNKVITEENIFQEKKEETINTKLPIYSETAKSKMKNIYNSNEKVVYLTFDDGPSQAVTPLILDLLKKENIKATFFVLGSSVKNNPELLKREYEEGHYIANHGYSHKYSKIYAKAANVLDEYNQTEKEIKKALDNQEYSSHLFRFPGGYYGGKYFSVKKQAAKLLNENNISYIDWNCLTGDAEGANTKEKIISYVKKYSEDKNSIVLLMHDAAAKILTYETLPDVIEFYRNKGYTFDNFYSIMQ